jgi:hypothetical protein
MISIEVDAKQLNRLIKATEKSGKQFPKEMSAAINTVAKKTRLNIGRDIRGVVAIKKDRSEKPITLPKIATPQSMVARVSIAKERREGLQHFSARQNGKGVSYKIDKRGGRKLVASAFMGPRPGVLAPRLNGGVFKRVSKSRNPIVKLYGVSPYGAYAKNDMSDIEVQFINKGLLTEMERRIKLNILRAEGLVSK